MSDQELSSLLSELKQKALQLNTESNSINTTISLVENEIVTANVGLEVFLDRGRADVLRVEGEEEAHLGFAKLDSGWHLVVRLTDDEGSPEDGPTCVQLAQASREMRIAALKRLPDLIRLINDKIRESVEAILDAKKLVN